MRRFLSIFIAVIIFFLLIFVGYVIWDRVTQVSSSDLVEVVQRDGVAFEG